MTAADLVRLGRRRASVHRYRVSDSFLAVLRKVLVLTGANDQLDRIVAAYLMVEDEAWS